MMDTGTIIIAAATIVTGIATCISAFVSWDEWRGRLDVEWDWYWSTDNSGQRTLEVRPIVVEINILYLARDSRRLIGDRPAL